MANYLDTLLDRIADADLAAALRGEVQRLRDQKQFGLVFEKHLPERVRLYGHPVQRGTSVEVRNDAGGPLWTVQKVAKGTATTVRNGEHGPTTADYPVKDLVVVREFGDAIYPGLDPVGRVERGGNKPFHSVIQAENYHALETLLYAYEGKIDCLYLDPPYNTGARDWKYNNDFVDANDGFRHSKWLSFMEKRLALARRLLHPDGVLILTIDENEVHHLGMLLERLFPDARTQMVSIVINPSGVSSGGGLSRVDEYAFFCFLGDAQPVALERDLLTDDEPNADYAGVRWLSLMRGGNAWYRSSRPNLCYPILVDDDGSIRGVGDPWPRDADESDRASTIDGYHAAWPVRADGRLGIWRVDRNRLIYLAERGYAHSTGRDNARGTWTVLYLLGGTVDAIEGGDLSVTGRGPHNEVLVEGTQRRTTLPKTVWKSSAHTAGGQGGTVLLNNLLGERNRFTYPKSVYAVRDALAAALGNRKEAVILDFFAGSGTTLHATALLNRSDDGRRQCILVTNNEVDGAVETRLRAEGHQPGDEEYDRFGIFNRVTKPRVEAAITGVREDGTPVPGTYIDGIPYAAGFDENVEFLALTYLDRDRVSRGRAFGSVAPLLWMKAGGVGTRIDSIPGDQPWALPDGGVYGVLFDASAWRSFTNAVASRPGTRHAYVVTNSAAVFQQVVAELPHTVHVTMLYEDYISTFEINTGAGIDP